MKTVLTKNFKYVLVSGTFCNTTSFSLVEYVPYGNCSFSCGTNVSIYVEYTKFNFIPNMDE